MSDITTAYQFRKTLDLPYETAIEHVTDALKTEGFGVLTQIDMQATLRAKLNADFRRYIILGACNPKLAHQALQNELEVGLLLPCNVIVYEGDTPHSSVVSIVDPLAMLGVVVNPALDSVVDEARTRLQRVADSL